jgi:hypothetical protein
MALYSHTESLYSHTRSFWSVSGACSDVTRNLTRSSAVEGAKSAAEQDRGVRHGKYGSITKRSPSSATSPTPPLPLPASSWWNSPTTNSLPAAASRLPSASSATCRCSSPSRRGSSLSSSTKSSGGRPGGGSSRCGRRAEQRRNCRRRHVLRWCRRRVAVALLSRQSRYFLVSLCVVTRASESGCVEARRLLCLCP